VIRDYIMHSRMIQNTNAIIIDSTRIHGVINNNELLKNKNLCKKNSRDSSSIAKLMNTNYNYYYTYIVCVRKIFKKTSYSHTRLVVSHITRHILFAVLNNPTFSTVIFKIGVTSNLNAIVYYMIGI